MSLWDNKLFARDVSSLVKLIEDHEVPIEVNKLYTLESQLKSAANHFIEVKDIAITVSKMISGTKPPGVRKIVIYFSHTFELDHTKDHTKYDPIRQYYFFYQINGYGSVANKEYVNCWRLDQDIVSSQSKYTHPFYHFQAGGDELQYRETGELLLLSAPRLPHPPMDLFLGIHFLLNNYLSTKDYPSVKDLFNDYEYEQIIKRAQRRMWDFYFDSFHSSNTHLDYTFQKVFPLFLH